MKNKKFKLYCTEMCYKKVNLCCATCRQLQLRKDCEGECKEREVLDILLNCHLVRVKPQSISKETE